MVISSPHIKLSPPVNCVMRDACEGDVVESRRRQDICGVNKVVFNFCPSVFGK